MSIIPKMPRTESVPMAKKSTCPISRKQFREKAQRIKVTIDGKEWTAGPKEFSTNSLGWNLNEKINIMIDGVEVTAQVGLNVTLVGSKELPLDAPPAAPAPASSADAAPAGDAPND